MFADPLSLEDLHLPQLSHTLEEDPVKVIKINASKFIEYKLPQCPSFPGLGPDMQAEDSWYHKTSDLVCLKQRNVVKCVEKRVIPSPPDSSIL